MSADGAALAAVLLRPAHDQPFPPSPARLFARRAPLAVEVGFGGGEALVWWARRRPGWNFIGFERALESVGRAAAAVAAAGLAERVRLVHGDARHLLREWIAPGAAQRVLMQFPMPWPKARHAKHRLTDQEFVRALGSALAPEGRFELVTDQEPFALEMAASLRSAGDFRVSALERNPERGFRTRYERRWLAAGRDLWRLTGSPVAARPLPSLSSPTGMDHLHLRPDPEPAQVHGLAGRSFPFPAGALAVQEVFTAADGWLLLALAADGGFAQRFYLRLRRRAGQTCLLSLEDCARPYPTPAVSALLAAVGAALGSGA